MDKRFWISGVVMAIATMLLGYVVHGVLLAGDYAALVGTIMRSPEEAGGLMQWMLLADICIGFAMTWFYRQGISVDRLTWGQGLRFGLAVALPTVIPQYLISPGRTAARRAGAQAADLRHLADGPARPAGRVPQSAPRGGLIGLPVHRKCKTARVSSAGHSQRTMHA